MLGNFESGGKTVSWLIVDKSFQTLPPKKVCGAGKNASTVIKQIHR
jgi:hypothetical protein